MEFTPLRTFLVVAEEASVTRAAARLHLTQPAVSGQIARLEAELGHRLFDRSSRGMLLTDAGHILERHAASALTRLDDARAALDELAGLRRGSLSIGGGATAITYLLPPTLSAFHARYPGIRLFVREQGSRPVLDAIVAGELDLGIVTVPEDRPGGRPGVPEAVALAPWVSDELRLIVPPGHPLAGRATFDWPALAGQPLVLFEAGTAVRRLIDERLEQAGVDVEIVMELRSIASIMQMVAAGIGAAFISRHALPSPEAGLAAADRPITRRLALAWRADRPPSAASEAFLELLRRHPLDAAGGSGRGAPPAAR